MRKSMQIAQRASLAAAAVVISSGLTMQVPFAAADPSTPPATPSPTATPSTSTEAKARIDQLQKEQTDLEGQYKAENDKLQRLMGQNESKRADIAALQSKVDGLKSDLGQVALAQYKAGGTSQSVQLVTAQDPGKFLTNMSQADKINSSVADQLRSLQSEQAQLNDMQRTLQNDQNAAQTSRDKLAGLDKQAKEKLTEAQKLFDKLSAEEKKKLEDAEKAKQAAANGTATASATGTPSTTGQTVSNAAPAGPSTDNTATYKGGSSYPQPSITPQGNAYDWGNCTAWVYDRRLQVGRPIGSFWGNAAQWPGSAAAAGFVVDNVPEVGAAYVQFGGYYGHVMFVERVNGDGTMLISEMNYNWMTGVRTERTIPAVGTFIH